jgi:hypothetical protein
MHGSCLDHPLHKWFDIKIPKTSIAPDFIIKALEEEEYTSAKPNAKIVLIGNLPVAEHYTKSKKGNSWEMTSLSFETKTETHTIQVNQPQGKWLEQLLPQLAIHNIKPLTLQQVKESYEAAGLEDFELFWDNKPVNTLYKAGLLSL